MNDLVKRLREQAENYNDGHGPLHASAANEIEMMRDEIKRLRAMICDCGMHQK